MKTKTLLALCGSSLLAVGCNDDGGASDAPEPKGSGTPPTSSLTPAEIENRSFGAPEDTKEWPGWGRTKENNMMSPEVIQKLLSINETFYREFSESWHTSRLLPWVGFARIAELIPSSQRFLDVGCGNGRLNFIRCRSGLLCFYAFNRSSDGIIAAR